MSLDEAFLRDVIEHPDDDAVRLIYADWLEERGGLRGEFIRLQIESEHLQEDDPRRPELEDRVFALEQRRGEE